VQFEYVDAPKGAKDWWLVSDHGYDVDILIKCSLKVMTQICICESTFNEALKMGDIKALGESKLVKRLQDWLRTSS
jgi:hypothetical protein